MSVRMAPMNVPYYPNTGVHHRQEQEWHSPGSIPLPTSPRWTCVGLPPEDAPCPGCALDGVDRQLGFGTPAPTFSELRSPPGSTSPNSAAPLSPLDVPVSSWTPIPMSPSKSSYTNDSRLRFNLSSPSSRNTLHKTTPCSDQRALPTTHTIHVTGAPAPRTREAIDQSSTRTAQTASNNKHSQGPGRNYTAGSVPFKVQSPTAGVRKVHGVPCSYDAGSTTRIQRVDRFSHPVTSPLRCSERAPVPVQMFLP
ncbi:hypothetical protein EDD15DRAFT_339544 [Pisolithus albus]|nr:hypothetical protein EDD15DRAFT_339544 [Pisolithus albus]